MRVIEKAGIAPLEPLLCSIKGNDAVRAIQSARDAGLAPAMVEVVVAKDGSVIYRVYGEDAVPASTSAEPGVSKGWQDEIDKLQKPK